VLFNIQESLSIYKERFELFFDLPYPKNKARIREFSMENGRVEKEKTYMIAKNAVTCRGCGDIIRIVVDEYSKSLAINSIIYFGDGEGAFRITDIQENYLVTEAMNDFTIFKNKGIACGYTSDTDKGIKIIDKINTIFDRKVTVLLSFLQTKEELDLLKKHCDLKNIQLIPKIELVEDKNYIPEIVKHSDGVLLARGDMGLINDINDLLVICHMASKQANLEQKRLIAATDIMTSYESRVFPSRADIFDLCMLHELGCTDIVLSYHISPHIDEIINLVSKLSN